MALGAPVHGASATPADDLRTALTGLLLASVPAASALAYDPAASSSGSYLAGRSAAKARDNTTVGRMAAVEIDPRTQGSIEDFSITSISEETNSNSCSCS